MFKSSQREIVVPQSEHARLAGLMAFHWGNADFDLSPLPFESFVKGVAFHDRGYPRLDTFPINGMPEDEWLKILETGAQLSFTDLEANIIVLMQIKRVALYNKTASRKKFADKVEKEIDDLIASSSYSEADFDFADQIAPFCDSVSYKFCFEEAGELELNLKAKQGDASPTKVCVEFSKEGAIKISPWPFKVKSFSGFLNAYNTLGYPSALDPEIFRFSISPT